VGYHLLPEGQILSNEIKNSWNNFRLSTSYRLNKNCKNLFLFLFCSPLEITFENKNSVFITCSIRN
jgi:hypothetical protein